MALGSTQSLRETMTMNISWGVKPACADNFTAFVCLNLLETSGPVQACTGIALLAVLYNLSISFGVKYYLQLMQRY
jgi:hypothetical protein